MEEQLDPILQDTSCYHQSSTEKGEKGVFLNLLKIKLLTESPTELELTSGTR